MSDLTSHMEAFAKAVLIEDLKWLITNPVFPCGDGDVEPLIDLSDEDAHILCAIQYKAYDFFMLKAIPKNTWNTKQSFGQTYSLILECGGGAVLQTEYTVSNTANERIYWLTRRLEISEDPSIFTVHDWYEWPEKLHKIVALLRHDECCSTHAETEAISRW